MTSVLKRAVTIDPLTAGVSHFSARLRAASAFPPTSPTDNVNATVAGVYIMLEGRMHALFNTQHKSAERFRSGVSQPSDESRR